MRDPLIDAWTRYWRSGRGASCTHGITTEVDFTMHWRDFFSRCADKARVLDLATGNGAVVRHAVQSTHLRITGIDAADIDPLSHGGDIDPLRKVLFLGSVWMEHLPFAHAAFDAVTSQFGIEYADEARACAELARVLMPGGMTRFVIHAHGGAVWRDVAHRSDRLRLALADEGVLTLLQDAAVKYAAGEQHPGARALATALGKFSTMPGEAADDAASFYVNGLLHIWRDRERYDPEGVSRAVNDAIDRARAVLLRQEALLRAARDVGQMGQLRRRLRAVGLDTATPEPVMDPHGQQVAWLLDGRRRATKDRHDELDKNLQRDRTAASQ